MNNQSPKFTVMVQSERGIVYNFIVRATSPAKAKSKVMKTIKSKWVIEHTFLMVVDGEVVVPNQPAGSLFGCGYYVTT